MSRNAFLVFNSNLPNVTDHLSASTSPDANLLAVCAQLNELRDEWQSLYDATSEGDELTTPDDQAWHEFSEHVWPCLQSHGSVDLPAQLLNLHATTPQGIQAKAAAIVALDEAGYYCDVRDDHSELLLSVLRDAAGLSHRPLGDDAVRGH